MGRPVEDFDGVLLLDRVEQAPLAVGIACAPYVHDDFDVAALSQVVVGTPSGGAGRRRLREPTELEPPSPFP